jgi:hypothetical protein
MTLAAGLPPLAGLQRRLASNGECPPGRGALGPPVKLLQGRASAARRCTHLGALHGRRPSPSAAAASRVVDVRGARAVQAGGSDVGGVARVGAQDACGFAVDAEVRFHCWRRRRNRRWGFPGGPRRHRSRFYRRGGGLSSAARTGERRGQHDEQRERCQREPAEDRERSSRPRCVQAAAGAAQLEDSRSARAPASVGAALPRRDGAPPRVTRRARR